MKSKELELTVEDFRRRTYTRDNGITWIIGVVLSMACFYLVPVFFLWARESSGVGVTTIASILAALVVVLAGALIKSCVMPVLKFLFYNVLGPRLIVWRSRDGVVTSWLLDKDHPARDRDLVVSPGWMGRGQVEGIPGIKVRGLDVDRVRVTFGAITLTCSAQLVAKYLELSMSFEELLDKARLLATVETKNSWLQSRTHDLEAQLVGAHEEISKSLENKKGQAKLLLDVMDILVELKRELANPKRVPKFREQMTHASERLRGPIGVIEILLKASSDPKAPQV